MPYSAFFERFREVAERETRSLKVHAGGRRMVDFMGRIVSVASLDATGRSGRDRYPCLKKPGKPTCSGNIGLVVVQGRVEWRCPTCGLDGIISNWRGSMWDLSGRPRAMN